MRRFCIFLLLFLVWVLLVWPFEPETFAPRVQDIVAGLVVALLVAAIMRDPEPVPERFMFNPLRIFWLLVYSVVLAYYIVKANFDVAYRVLHPDMPIRPGIVKVKTNLKRRSSLTALANSITLTPGTLTVSATDDGTLYVHWINVRTVDTEEATQQIVSRFEWFIRRIFD